MLDLIREILQSNAGSFGFVFAFLVLAFWGIHYVTKKVTEINSEHGGFKKSVDKIEVSIDAIRQDISYLKGSLDVYKSGKADQLIKSKSPVSLTDKGKEVSNELKAEEIIGRTWDTIYKILEENISDKNAYDIQQYCFEKISVDPEKYFDKDGINALKIYAFKEGSPLQLYTRLLAILIRDKYLETKGISLSEIDKYDPKV